MAHFALINDKNTVIEVIVAEQEFIDNAGVDLAQKLGGTRWIQTSYNTRMGVHYGADGTPDGGAALRMNFAGIGFIYNPQLDAFIPPKPAESWVLDPNRGTWTPPFPPPDDGNQYVWDNTAENWRLSIRPGAAPYLGSEHICPG